MSLPPCIESSINVRQNLSNWFFVFVTCRRVAQQCLCVLTLNLRYTSLAVHRSGIGPLLPIVRLNLTQRVLNANYDEKWQLLLWVQLIKNTNMVLLVKWTMCSFMCLSLCVKNVFKLNICMSWECMVLSSKRLYISAANTTASDIYRGWKAFKEGRVRCNINNGNPTWKRILWQS